METQLPLQPPPDATAPPPGPEAIRSRKHMRYLLWVGGISVIFAIVVGVIPWWQRTRVISARTHAVNNIKQIHLELLRFQADYGRFPDDTTIASVQSKTHTTLALGTSTSNDYFRQLIAAGAKSETIFWTKTPATPRKPNGILGTDALKKGECSFAYVAGLSNADDPMAPVVVTPMIPGTQEFDSTVFYEKAVTLRVDGSVRLDTIRSDNHEVSVGAGRTLFQPSMPYWHGKKPNLKWPE